LLIKTVVKLLKSKRSSNGLKINGFRNKQKKAGVKTGFLKKKEIFTW